MKLIRILWCVWLILLGARFTLAVTPEVRTPEDVAPKVAATRQQRWPRAVWCAGVNCWLVVWREGDLSEQETDIWCARVGADGKALDPEGIQLTRAKGVQDRPVIASDGKGFLVAWSDFRNGKDWDVYAARVSGDGKVLDPDGFLVAGGKHNQCYPTVAFAGENYIVVWQAWIEDVFESRGTRNKFGSYGLRGTRINLEGSVLDREGKILADATATAPSIASDGDRVVQLVWIGRSDRQISGAGGFGNKLAAARVDPAKLEIQGAAGYIATDKDSVNTLKQNMVPGLTLLPTRGAMMSVRGYKGGTTIFRIDERAHKVGECVRIHNYAYDAIDVFSSLACSGDFVLFTQDWPSTPTGKRVRLGVWGWLLSPDGEVLAGGKDGFAIAADPSKDSVQGFASAGPIGVFLVVYAEPRRPDDTKVVARIVKTVSR